MNKISRLIFTDLDGSLLDHHDYSFAAAKPLLQRLEQLGIPVICSTSKTFAELLPIRRQMHNRHPFIVENGAGVAIPQGYFAPEAESGAFPPFAREGYAVYPFSHSREHWQGLLEGLENRYAGQFTTFSRLGTEGVAEATGLSATEAVLANARDFSEPVQWLGDEQGKQHFIRDLQAQGANVLQGGRFLQVSGDCDKGRAMRWLAGLYEQSADARPQCIAVGDSDNDIAMLEAADQALIIRSPVNPAPIVHAKVLVSRRTGPDGWVEGIERILDLG